MRDSPPKPCGSPPGRGECSLPSDASPRGRGSGQCQEPWASGAPARPAPPQPTRGLQTRRSATRKGAGHRVVCSPLGAQLGSDLQAKETGVDASELEKRGPTPHGAGVETTSRGQAHVQILPRLSRQSARGIVRWAKKQTDTGLLVRAQIVALLGRGRRARETADLVGSVRSHVYRTARRFRDRGRDGLLDGRRDNGQELATEAFDRVVLELISGSPSDGGFKRPTWTRELLVRVAAERTGIRVSLTAWAQGGDARSRP